MKNNKAMRPQDIVILLYIISIWNDLELNNQNINGIDQKLLPNNKNLAFDLRLSESEISESLYRSLNSGLLLDVKNRIVNRISLFEFLVHGLKYCFPARPGAMVRGISTAHSAKPLDKLLVSTEEYVWPHAEGDVRGQAIEPLYVTVPEVALNKPHLYELLSLVDAIRTGSARTIALAKKELENILIKKNKNVILEAWMF
jgi:hypothetical protein